MDCPPEQNGDMTESPGVSIMMSAICAMCCAYTTGFTGMRGAKPPARDALRLMGEGVLSSHPREMVGWCYDGGDVVTRRGQGRSRASRSTRCKRGYLRGLKASRRFVGRCSTVTSGRETPRWADTGPS